MDSGLLKQCRDKSFEAFGTSKIFEKRMQRLNRLRNLTTFFGIVVPLVAGGFYLSFGTRFQEPVSLIAGILVTLQLIVSAWSIVDKWDDKHAYAITAMQNQTKLYNSWGRIAKTGNGEICQTAFNELDKENERLESQDLAQNISPKEKRYAMRESLYEFNYACVKCHIIPKTRKPSDCDTCGNF